MSTRIYNGYKTPLSTTEIWYKLSSLKPKIEKTRDDFLRGMIEHYIKFSPKVEERTYTDFCLEYNYLHLDHQFDVVLFPQTGSTLFLLFGHQYHKSIHRKIIRALKGTEYGYWDASDKPPKVSRKNWRLRKSDWDTVLTGPDKSGKPSEYGLTYCLARNEVPLSLYNDVVVRILPPERRLQDEMAGEVNSADPAP